MAAVVEPDRKNLDWSQGSKEFSDFGSFTGGFEAAEQIAFQLKSGAVRLQFGVGDPALGVEMTDDFHKSRVRWESLKMCTVEDLNL